jgi:putative ABC transport system ATP-binding protein
LGRPVEVLSGGQQQRVAIARALAHRPQLLFADEPTGNLHDTLSRQVMELLTRLVEESGCSLLLVTHNHEMAAFAQRRLLLEEGHLHSVP